MCQGRGIRPGLFRMVPCQDCKGTGRVHHCVACGGRGQLWLGPGEGYIDCPVCPSARGGIRTARTYVEMGGRLFERVPMKAGVGG